MIELGVGLLMILGAAAIATGIAATLAGGIDLLPLIGLGGTAVLAAAGLLIGAAGALRLAIRRHDAHRHLLRSARLTAASLLILSALALGAPLAADMLNLVQMDGVRLGYLVAAQVSLAGLALLAFVWALRQNRIDAQDLDSEDLGS